MFSVGDKVKIKNHPDEVTGEVIRRTYGGTLWGLDYIYHVEFDNKQLIPPIMEYQADHLILVSASEKKLNSFNKCECGAKFNRSFPDIHMFYCPEYRKP